ncbi:MAG: hypothetical protein JW929_04935 [Anaerolineales bacterium]|nr:hypothetical protein [Anaerolineales bacterium]
MADTRCSMCGKLNPAAADSCQYCGARLKPMQAGGSKGQGAAPPAGGEGGVDWMSDLRGDMMRNRPKTSMLPPEPPRPTPSDDWLQKIDSRGEPSPPAAPPGKPSPPIRSSRLASKPAAGGEPVRREAPAAPPPQEGAPETPTWLSKVRAQVSAKREPEPPETPKGDEDPAWLKRLRVRHTQDELTPATPPGPPEEAAAPGELPDWLSKIRDQSADGSGIEEGAFPKAPAADSLGESRQGESSLWGTPAPAQKPQSAPPTAGPEVPDWMQYPSPASGLAGGEPPLGSPDWIGDISSALEQTPPTPAAAPARADGGEGRPSTGRLLSGADRGRGPGAMPPSAPSPTHPFTDPDSLPPGAPSAFEPDWPFPTPPTDFPFPNPAADQTVSSGSSAFHGGMDPIVSPGGEEEIPDWLADAKSAPAVLEPEPAEEPAAATPDLNELLRPDSMPEWLSKPAAAGTADAAAEGPAARPALPENLEQAELPRWLEAMRPIQSVAVPTEDDERVESVGPLAGLRGVLSAEPVVAMPRRPGIMAGNIDALPAQMAMTETLRRLLIEPEVRAARKPVRAMLLTPILRKVMSAVLILAIFLPVFTGPIFSNAVYQPQANIQAGDLVSALPADRMVLAAFEYDASRAPEIETGATVMLEHLAQRGIRIVFISSQPNGTMLGEGLLAMNRGMGIAMPDLAADFGYIPGGAGGLRRLGGNLREVITDTTLDWDNGPLSAVRAVSDFSMILIFAADPQSVRDWIEQVHTAAPNTPIVAMVSAAADALVFPYTQGSQPSLRGLVAGYTGAQAYRAHFLPATMPVEGVIAMRWQAYASGTLALLLTLTAGIIGSLVLRFTAQQRKGAG